MNSKSAIKFFEMARAVKDGSVLEDFLNLESKSGRPPKPQKLLSAI